MSMIVQRITVCTTKMRAIRSDVIHFGSDRTGIPKYSQLRNQFQSIKLLPKKGKTIFTIFWTVIYEQDL